MKSRNTSHILFGFAAALLLTCSSVAFAGRVPDTGDPAEAACNPRSYIDQANGIISDNVTGLLWQAASAPDTYNWRDALNYCAGLTLGGYSDWRLPTIKELSTLVDCGIALPGPAINTDYFPDTEPSDYWSSTPGAYGAGHAWRADFSNGYVSYGKRWEKHQVRAVRGVISYSNFADNGDGTITDTSTGLMWEKTSDRNTYTWSQAKDYCDALNLGGYSDWRLPTRNELQTLVHYGRFNPAISMSFFPALTTSYFPETAPSYYWTSTISAGSAGVAWYVHFRYGYVHYIDKYYYNHVRAVRAGQCGPPSSTTTTVAAGPCPAEQMLGQDNQKLEQLRAFRDSRLARSGVGRRLIRMYYDNTESINAALGRSPTLRTAARYLLEAVAACAGKEPLF